MSSQAVSSNKGSQRLGSYLRRLRTGYGYSLRRVEKRARAEGGEIDNSQLSRYEKGICYPSFDKLRVLASVFNVSIQSFSDVVELEAYEELKPASGEPESLLQAGTEALFHGNSGRAFAHYERALELLLETEEEPDLTRRELIGQLRVHQAIALRRLGKLSLAEQELRNALRTAEHLSPSLRVRAIVTLASIHAQQGERFLAELEAGRAHDLARAESLDRMAAMALHIQANVLSEQGQHREAIERFRETEQLYQRCNEPIEALRVRISVGTSFVAMGKTREGIRLLRETLPDVRKCGHRRLEALAWSHMGEAYFHAKDPQRAQGCLRQSDTLAVYDNGKYNDILFLNAYYQWKIAESEDNPTRTKIALGRLKVLRSSLEMKFREVEAFDRYMERRRADA
jgi:transcriptional regulator with XRE-family HTH domain